jgi:polyphosphate kinase 2 (PPK2 family)
VLKFFLHLSKEEQRQRLLARAEAPDKHWKISSADLESRSRWDDFQKVYGECLQHTSHQPAPWYAVPADDKRNARLIVSRILVDTLRGLPLTYPTPDRKQLDAVEAVRKALQGDTG